MLVAAGQILANTSKNMLAIMEGDQVLIRATKFRFKTYPPGTCLPRRLLRYVGMQMGDQLPILAHRV